MPHNNAVEIRTKQYGDWLQTDQSSLYFRKRVYFTDFATAATTGNVDVLQPDPWTHFPAGIEIEGAGISLITNFTGGGAGTATLSVGTTGDAVAYVAATSVFSGAYKKIAGKTLVPFTFLEGTGAPAKSTVRVALVCDVNTNLLTAGKADIYLKLRAVSVRNT